MRPFVVFIESQDQKYWFDDRNVVEKGRISKGLFILPLYQNNIAKQHAKHVKTYLLEIPGLIHYFRFILTQLLQD